MKSWARFWLLAGLGSVANAQDLPLPPRPQDAPGGSELVQRLTPLELAAREEEVLRQVAAGNIPDFLRRLCPVTVTSVAGGRTNTATFRVTPDYLAVGSDTDYFLTPLTPDTAQRIANLTQCSLPTRKMVDAIYAAAEVKLSPTPVPPSPAMTTVPVFAAHDALVKTQRAAHLKSAPPGALVAGHKKDVVLSAKLAQAPGKVAIYGWHRTNGAPIQPLYTGHTAAWADYSHGIRLVSEEVTINGQTRKLGEVLADAELASLLSDEGPITNLRYATNALPRPPGDAQPASVSSAKTRFTLADFKPSPHFDEQTLGFALEPGVKIHINAPAWLSPATNRELLLVFYALPNGNTTEQTIGRILKPGDDWHFDIQHIGAQTRWLRRHAPGRAIVVAYLENTLKSWPAWRRQHGDAQIPALLETVKDIFRPFQVRVVLTGHSGGGSLTFGWLNTLEAIPDEVERIAFLDSNYAYETERHQAKLVTWLKASKRHSLCVLAYNDAVALLEGKPFVSAAGGTWGRSHAMLEDLGRTFAFSRQDSEGLRRHTALDGRIQFLLKENPDRKILHTVQVERNGFIHALLTGTPQEGTGYAYLGERAYASFVSAE